MTDERLHQIRQYAKGTRNGYPGGVNAIIGELLAELDRRGHMLDWLGENTPYQCSCPEGDFEPHDKCALCYAAGQMGEEHD